uniref:SH3 domain-containing protein n=1 Tax=Timema genevievae TaxID=629358 RepID=A0A7R9JS18_TIMGE|nr:unnamed protein product [Timema genevievae]
MKGKSEEDQCVGSCFLQVADKMKLVYGLYCMNHDNALTLFEKYESNPDIKAAFDKGLETLRYQIVCFDMSSILIKPVQRILKYPLIINELIKGSLNSGVRKESKSFRIWSSEKKKVIISHDVKFIDDELKDVDGSKTPTDDSSRHDRHHVDLKQNPPYEEENLTLASNHLNQKEDFCGFGPDTEPLVPVIAIRCFHNTLVGAHESAHVDCLLFFFGRGTIRDVFVVCGACRDEPNGGRIVTKYLDIDDTISSRMSKISLHSVAKKSTRIGVMLSSSLGIKSAKSSVERRVMDPLNTLLAYFDGPEKLVQKRNDKLLDYDGYCARADKLKDNRQHQHHSRPSSLSALELSPNSNETSPVQRVSGQLPSYEEVVLADISENSKEDDSNHVYEEIPDNVEYFYALYNFVGNGEYMLTVQAGQVVKVLHKEDFEGNPEWWLVENHIGSKGYVPANYLSKYTS